MSQPTYEGLLRNVAFPDQLLTLDPRSRELVGDPAIDGPDSAYQIWRVTPVSPGPDPDGDREGYRTLWNVGAGVFVVVTDHHSVISTSSDPYKWFAILSGSDIGFQVYNGPTLDLPSSDPGRQVELVLNAGELKPQELWRASDSDSRAL